MNGALIEATLPVVISKTCVAPSARSFPAVNPRLVVEAMTKAWIRRPRATCTMGLRPAAKLQVCIARPLRSLHRPLTEASTYGALYILLHLLL
jgi:hypothetical protein